MTNSQESKIKILQVQLVDEDRQDVAVVKIPASTLLTTGILKYRGQYYTFSQIQSAPRHFVFCRVGEPYEVE